MGMLASWRDGPHLVAVDEQRGVGSFGQAVAVVGELHPYLVISRVERLGAGRFDPH